MLPGSVMRCRELLRNIAQNAYNSWPVTVYLNDLGSRQVAYKRGLQNEREFDEGTFMNQPIKNLKEAPAVEVGPAAKPRSRRRFVVLSLLALLIVGGGVWWSRQGSAPEKAPGGGRNAAPMSIVPEVVGKGDIGININALGTVTSLATATIRSQISGQLVRIAFKEGDDVKKGDLLAEIDSRPYEATLAQAKGQLARDEALLKGAQVYLTRYQGLAAQ